MQIKKLILILLVCFIIVLLPLEKSNCIDLIHKTYSDIDILYSFSNQIKYIAVSQNNEKMISLVKENYTNKYILYIANSNGTGIKEIFHPGIFNVDLEEKYLEIGNNLPVISGDGTKLAIGLVPSNDLNYKSDYIMTYDIKSGRYNFFSLRILIPGTTYSKFSNIDAVLPKYSMDYSGSKIVCQIEVGLKTSYCESFDTAIIILNFDGSNQKILAGPNQFNRNNCSFEWFNYPKSPHYPLITYNGDKVIFFGQIFMTNNPYEKNGEIFVINSNGSNLKQLTFSKRFDKKIESIGFFNLNYYGSRIYFKSFIDNIYYISSISIDGGNIQSHMKINESDYFFISGDGRKIFFIDSELENSLVYYDIMNERKNIIIDFTWSGKPNNYLNLENVRKDNIYSANLSNFTGNNYFIKTNFKNNFWIFLIRIDDSINSLRETTVEMKINKTTASINDKLVSLEAAPYIKNKRTMIPLRLIGDAFGANTSWNASRLEITLKINGNTIQLYTNKNYIYINGKKETIEISPEIKYNRLFVPIKVVSSYLGLLTIWNKDQTITIQRVNQKK
jgi:hypothetical protein